VTTQWERAHHPSANAQEKPSTYAAEDAEDEATTSPKKDAAPAATEKHPSSKPTPGEQKPYTEKD
jgi:hypothetical protein